MDLLLAKPLKGNKLKKTIEFLSSLGLGWEENIEATIIMIENGAVIATASRQRNVLKCIGVLGQYQGEGLSAIILTELIKDAYKCGQDHLFLFTKPDNNHMFSELGFYEIAGTKDAVLMENKKNGIVDFIRGISKNSTAGVTGCIVANCNPFTNGHLYLVEKAATSCDFLYLFILSEELQEFSTADRFMMAKRGTKHIKNISVNLTGDYMVSTATFPQYFLKDVTNTGKVSCELDLAIFARHFAPCLNICMRFVGCEPYCRVTAAYNERMKQLLPDTGIQVIEIPRKEIGGNAVSASRVRALLKDGQLELVKQLVPESTYALISNT